MSGVWSASWWRPQGRTCLEVPEQSLTSGKLNLHPQAALLRQGCTLVRWVCQRSPWARPWARRQEWADRERAEAVQRTWCCMMMLGCSSLADTRMPPQ